MFSTKNWDGLAKIGTLKLNDKTITTPALFPVVDPRQQTIPIQDFKSVFGFDQVITSAYLMSKRLGHTNWASYPAVHEYLSYNGMVMMDSGAYQIMLYGDIELDPQSTIELQKQVKPEIGVIMDHPIGYDVPHHIAEKRVNITIENLNQTLQWISAKDQISWTLPIQGGKYLDLLEHYLQVVMDKTQTEILEKFSFYALGSVVPVMINQDYSTLVRMISIARKYLPTTHPLHLFGAGHPSMFALATFLGCDTFDSAAYALMAKDGRYMTTNGTYHISELQEFPCHCPICIEYTPKSLRKLPKQEKLDLLSKHNLWVSISEIKTIRNAIQDDTLWDLVLQRATSVPHLMRATRLAIETVSNGILKQKFYTGTPIRKTSMVRINNKLDLRKPAIARYKDLLPQIVERMAPKELILLAVSSNQPLYQKTPDSSLGDLDVTNKMIFFLLPNIGLIPHGLSDNFPFGQFINELEVVDTSYDIVLTDLKKLKLDNLQNIHVIIEDTDNTAYIKQMLSRLQSEPEYSNIDIQIIQTDQITSTIQSLSS